MSRVDFYILQGTKTQDRFACDIAGKAWQNGNNVYIHTASRDAAMTLDDLLWTFNDISFIPHAVIEAGSQPDVPVMIGWNGDPPGNSTVMINLTGDIPAFAGKFAIIVEVVAGSDEEKDLARQRYRGYRDGGHEMYNHTIENDDHT